MTEAEWDSCTDGTPMLAFLRDMGRASERKLRLFGCGLCRLTWCLPTDDRCEAAVAAGERFADGQLGGREREEAFLAAGDLNAEFVAREEWAMAWLAMVARWALAEPLTPPHWRLRTQRADGPRAPPGKEHPPCPCTLLRELFGPLPFRNARIDPAWLSWQGGTAPKLARAVYDERAFDRLPVLADALEEAGCTDAELLAHCRAGGGHVRGCWAVDLILGKA